MAPPSPRRPGFSRRAQYSLFAGYVVAVLGAAVGLLLVITARFDPAGHQVIQQLASDVFSPISRAGSAAVRAVADGGSTIAAYFDAASKNKAMSAELKAARQKLIQGQADALENKHLKALLRIIETDPKPVIIARLISSTGESSRRYATLDAGGGDGVTTGQPVRSSDGLVGRILTTGRTTSRILLIVDGGNIVPVKRVSDGVPALAIGIGDGRLDLRPLAAGSNPFNVGDVFVTSGTGGIYRPGIPVAVGVRRTREATTARPLADPSQLEFAIVEPIFITPPPEPANMLPKGGS
ncbi:MAG: rod shape-determining protein MreC [Pseudomonadota bacterium]|jgi:rod shape-determining protein MreC